MHVVEGFGKHLPLDTPGAPTLRNAVQVSLGRHPDTPEAQAFVTALMPLMVPHMTRGRIGPKALGSLARDLGTIMAGIMRPGLQGIPVRAQASASGPMWEGQRIGRDRFWGIVDALCAAGFLAKLEGVRTPATFGSYGGLAAALWPTTALIDLAGAAGCTVDTRKADWRADASLAARERKVPSDGLVTCRPLQGVPLALTPAMQDSLAGMRQDLQAINAANAAADIRGAGWTVTMVRRFQHSPALGGRFYAPHTVMSPEDRARITMAGEPVVEVDVKASQLTILLGIMGHREVHGDPYAFPGIPRACVKQWVIQTLGAGKPAGAWSDRGGGGASWPSTRAVWEAVRPRYGFLADLAAIVPAADLEGVPGEWRGKAAGQWLVQREATIMARVLGDLAASGIPALPVHDSVIVPRGGREEALRGLEAAFVGLGGVRPILTG